jgi:hypothetical protein
LESSKEIDRWNTTAKKGEDFLQGEVFDIEEYATLKN